MEIEYESIVFNFLCDTYELLDATAYSNARFGQGAGLIHLDNVACVGMEPNITSCTYDADTSDCLHTEDASVSCVTDCKSSIEIVVLCFLYPCSQAFSFSFFRAVF